MFASNRQVIPHAGKRDIAMTRVRHAAGIIGLNGANTVRIFQVGGGHGAGTGTLHVNSFFSSMEQGMKISENLMSDPSWASLMAERELVPAGDIVGPNVVRLVAGEVKAENNAFMVREYIMDRSNWNDAINMVANVQKLLTDHGVNVTMWVPVIADDMKRVWAIYSGATPSSLGKSIDEVGMTKEFQEMLVEASKLGTLDKAWGMVGVR